MKTLRVMKRADGAAVLRVSAVAAGALLVCAAVSCKKDAGPEAAPVERVSSFHASSEGHSGDGKTLLDGLAVKWVGGDAVAVWGTPTPTEGEAATATWNEYATTGGGSASAVFNGPEITIDGDNFYAIYPYSAATGVVTNNQCMVSLPKYQVSKSGQTGTFVNGANAMAAKSENAEEFMFKNLCGVLRLRLSSLSETVVKSIQVVSKAGEKLWGNYTVMFNDGDVRHSLAYKSGGDNSVMLVYPGGVDISKGATEFDIVLPGGVLTKGFDLEVYCEYGEGGSRKGVYFMSSSKASITQNRITAMDELTITTDGIREGVLPGRFSVSSDTQVHFSQGNLQYNPSEDEWRFAKNQIDASGAVGADYADTGDNWIDLFGWGTSNHEYRILSDEEVEEGKVFHYKPWSTGVADNDIYGPAFDDPLVSSNLTVDDKSDWGWNKISNGGDMEKSGWRSLQGDPSSQTDELDYLLGIRAGAKYVKATVLGVKGLLVFPDGIPVVSNKAVCCGVEILSPNFNGSFSDNEIVSSSDWSALEAAGVVFLPSAGYREGNSVLNREDRGFYWVSTANGANACYFSFNPSNFYPIRSNFRFYGRSVRLVLVL